MLRPSTALATVAGLLLLGACDQSSQPAEFSGAGLKADSVVTGSISGVLSTPDSQRVLQGRILAYHVGSIPPDSIPTDSVPPDSVPPDSTGLTGTVATLPAGLFRGDSIPPDSTPPAPACGARGTLVARAQPNRNGVFKFSGLTPGVYDLRATSPAGQGLACGLVLHEGEHIRTGIVLTPADSTPRGGGRQP